MFFISDERRKSGIEFVGDIAWGTHMCIFSENVDELLEILLPFFSQGLKSNEYCILTTKDQFFTQKVKNLLEDYIPNFCNYLTHKQLVFQNLEDAEWNNDYNDFSQFIDKIKCQILSEMEQALANGFSGLRISFDPFTIINQVKDHLFHLYSKINLYEKMINDLHKHNKLISLCSYPLTSKNVPDVIEISNKHHCTLIKRQGEWTKLDNPKCDQSIEKLLRSEELLRMVMENSQDSIILLDLQNLHYMFLGTAHTKISGFSLHELNQMTPNEIFERIHPEDRNLVLSPQQLMNLSPNENELGLIEYRFKVKSGEYRWLSDNRKLVHDCTGRPIALVTVCRDISNQKKTEALLASEKELSQALIDSIPVMITIYNPKLKKFTVNNEFEKITKFTNKDFENAFLPTSNLNFPTLLEKIFHSSKYRQATINLESWPASGLKDITIRAKDGTNIESSWASVRFADDRQVGIGFDIRERKKAELALKESEKLLDAFFNNINAVMIIYDEDNRYVRLNKYSMELYGLPENQIVGKHVLEVASSPMSQKIIELNRTVLMTKQALQTESICGYFPLGPDRRKKKYWKGVRFPVPLRGGKTGIGTVNIDITDQILAEEEASARKKIRDAYFKNSPFSLAILDENLKYIQTSDSMAQLFYGQDPSFIEGKSPRELDPTSAPILEDLFLNVIETEKTTASEKKIYLPSKKRETDLLIVCFPIPLAYEKIGVGAASIDMSIQKKIETDLRKSEERFRSILENSRDIIYCFNPKTLHYDYISPSLKTITGFSTEEWTSMDINELSSLVHPDDISIIQKSIQQLQECGKTELEYRQKNKNGEYQWFSSNISLIEEKSSGNFYHYGNTRDITNIKLKEESLWRLNRILKAHSDINLAMIHIKCENLFMETVCKIIFEDCGHTMVWIGLAQDNKEKSVLPVAYAGEEKDYIKDLNISWADNPYGQGPTGTTIRTGQISICKNILIDPDFWPWRSKALKCGLASSIVFPLKDGDLTFGAISIYSRDTDSFSAEEIKLLTEIANNLAYGIITIRASKTKERVEQELRDKETRLRMALEAAHAGTWEWDLNTNLGIWSEEIWPLFGLPSSVRPSIDAWIECIAPEHIDTVTKIVESTVREGKELYLEWQVKGTNRWISSRGRPVRDNNDKIEKYVGIIIDITERKIFEKELILSNQELEQFASVASHDLKEPLRLVSIFTEMLKNRLQGHLDQEGSKEMEVIIEESTRMSKLVDDLLAYSRIGKKDNFKCEVDLDEILKLVTRNLIHSIQETGAEIIYGKLPKVYAIESSMVQLFQNLISNAMKFHRPGVSPKVNISVEQKEKEYLFSVNDNGIGIPPKHFHNIFVIFQRLHSKEKYHGTGIGLTIVKKIIETHGGKIWVESTLGQGTTFYFTLPIKA